MILRTLLTVSFAMFAWVPASVLTFELSFADKCLLISADTRHSASLDVETTLHFLTSGKGTERRSTN